MEAYAFAGVRREQRAAAARDAGVVIRRRAAGNGGFTLTATSSKAAPKAVKAAATKAVAKKPVDAGEVFRKAGASAFRGGVAGLVAGVAQVGTFMWMRTVMNYQYANGGTLMNALTTLLKEGGVRRLYQGVSFAIIQNPLSRFGDTAANVGVLALMDAFFPGTPVALKTGLASAGGAAWRFVLTPVDTLKTTLQVKGPEAFALLAKKVAAGGRMGFTQLYGGAIANYGANIVGNYPWFVTFNFLQARWPAPADKRGRALRNALIGALSSCVSDTVSNSLRVIKTVKQTNADASLSYIGVVRSVLAKDGMKGLFGRGLQTRLITNICQSMVFSVAWKMIEEALNERAAKAEAAKKAAGAKSSKSAAAGKKAVKASLTLAALPHGLAGSSL